MLLVDSGIHDEPFIQRGGKTGRNVLSGGAEGGDENRMTEARIEIDTEVSVRAQESNIGIDIFVEGSERECDATRGSRQVRLHTQ